MTVLVEFVGLPGVGKSTLSAEAGEVLSHKHPTIAEPNRRIDDRVGIYRLLTKARFAAEHSLRRPRAALSAAQNLLKTNQPTLTDNVRVGFNLQYVGGVMAQNRSVSGVSLLDQGPYQAVWSVGLRSSSEWSTVIDRFDRYFSQNSPDLVVFVEAEHETITERLRSRDDGDTRFAPGSPRFDRGVEGYEYIKKQLQSNDDSPRSIVVENETRADLAAGAERIAEVVSSISD